MKKSEMRVAGVNIMLVDPVVFEAACKEAKVEWTGVLKDDVIAYDAYVRGLPKCDVGPCDKCGGVSRVVDGPEVCPYCGEGDVDVTSPPPKVHDIELKASKKKLPKKVAQVAERMAVEKGWKDPKPSKPSKPPKPAKAKPEKAPKVKPEKAPKTKSEKAQVAIVVDEASHTGIEVGTAIRESIDEAVADVRRAKGAAVRSYWDLGNAILGTYKGDLWKQARDQDNIPIYTSFRTFCENELEMSPRYAYQLMGVADKFSEADIAALGVAKLGLMLQLPPAERAQVLVTAKETKASSREVASMARAAVQTSAKEIAVEGVGKKAPQVAAASAASVKAAAEKRKLEVITITSTELRVKVPLFCRSGFGNPDKQQPARKLDDAPVAEWTAANGVVLRYTIQTDATGQLQLIVDHHRAS